MRNLRGHFFSESRMKLASILPSVRNVYGAKLHEHFLSKLRRNSNNDIVHNLYLMFGHCLRSADVVVQVDIIKTKVGC